MLITSSRYVIYQPFVVPASRKLIKLLLLLLLLSRAKNDIKKVYLKKIWNDVRLVEEEREDLEIRGCRK